MKTLYLIMLFCLCSVFAFANTATHIINHDKILSDFDIQNSPSNKELVEVISKSVNKLEKNHFKDIIKSKSRHAYLIKSELEDINAPEFLLYLAMVESKLSNKATSGAKAGGMWQFIPSTAKKYGLKIDSYVDERRDPMASTDAAFKYMTYLKNYFGKWYLALMAYNCGEGCISKAIAKTGSDDFYILLKSQAIPKETKNFIKKIIRYSYIAGAKDIRTVLEFNTQPSKLRKIVVRPGTRLEDIGSGIGISLANMKDYNTHIKQSHAPKNVKEYHFYIPEKKYELYAANFILSKYKPVNTDYRIHIVENGETISHIAKKWGVDVKSLIVENNIKSDKILVNQKLRIPINNEIPAFDIKEYLVKQGDTLDGISKMFDVDIEKIAKTNNIQDSKISVGDKIVIP